MLSAQRWIKDHHAKIDINKFKKQSIRVNLDNMWEAHWYGIYSNKLKLGPENFNALQIMFSKEDKNNLIMNFNLMGHFTSLSKNLHIICCYN